MVRWADSPRLEDAPSLAIAFLVGALGYLVACVDMRDRALVALAESRPVADQFAADLHTRCTVRYAAAITREDVARLDAVCLPARRALDDYRDAWVDLLFAVQRDASDDEIRESIARLHARRGVLAWPSP